MPNTTSKSSVWHA